MNITHQTSQLPTTAEVNTPEVFISDTFGLSVSILLFFYLFFGVLTLIAYAMIIKKTGNNACLGIILALIPGVNWIYLIYLAASTWPIEKEIERLENAVKFERQKESKHKDKNNN